MVDTLIINAVQKAFPGISDAQAEDIAQIGNARSYSGGVTLCMEGAVEYVFYIVLAGEVAVSKVINEGEDRFLTNLGPGDFFGEYALIQNERRSATVATTRPTTVLEIHRPVFEGLLRRSPKVLHAMLREVSQRLRHNDDLAIKDLHRRAGELAEAYQRLAEVEYARSEFLTTIAHELRTPLTAANGFLQMIQSGRLQDEALKDAISTVADNVQRIVALSNDILFLQEMDLVQGQASTVDIGQILVSAMDKLHLLAEQNQVRFCLNLPPRPAVIMGDREGLERAFAAILENAVKFSPDGGDVVITIHNHDKQIVVKIDDPGVGIPPDALPAIFDRFFRLGRVGDYLFGGVGLGLSIARSVIEGHGGKIEVSSVLGNGSSFIISLDPADGISESNGLINTVDFDCSETWPSHLNRQ